MLYVHSCHLVMTLKPNLEGHIGVNSLQRRILFLLMISIIVITIYICNKSPVLPLVLFLFCHSNFLLVLFPQNLVPPTLLLLLLLSYASSPPLISCSLIAPPHFLLFPSLYLRHSSVPPLHDHNAAATCPFFKLYRLPP